jgi:two-component system, cell cycle response regulator DivK
MPTILVVEDNEDNRDSLTRRLQRRGFAVVTASDGLEGVQAADNERPDLVLMDINMPDLDGWEATRQIHALAGLEKLPIIALTAHAMGGDRDRALEAGCVDYHAKPIEFDKLMEQIEAALRSQAGTAG